ncbi:MAG: response regulator [Minisyncoccota bacterium]
MDTALPAKWVVCIVDDNQDIRDIYRLKFQREGFEVVTAVNGAEGLEIIKQTRPNIVLLDMEMPILNGIGLLKILRQDTELRKIPVVILSNVDHDDMFQEVSELGGATYYLVKSITTPQKVVDITAKALAESKDSTSEQ